MQNYAKLYNVYKYMQKMQNHANIHKYKSKVFKQVQNIKRNMQNYSAGFFLTDCWHSQIPGHT